jgi:hypothetical protein
MPFQSKERGDRANTPPDSKNRPPSLEDFVSEGEIETIARVAIDKALGGDVAAIRLVLDLIDPV